MKKQTCLDIHTQYKHKTQVKIITLRNKHPHHKYMKDKHICTIYSSATAG